MLGTYNKSAAVLYCRLVTQLAQDLSHDQVYPSATSSVTPLLPLFRKEEPQPPLSARHYDMEESEVQWGSQGSMKVSNSMSTARRGKLVGAHIMHAVQSCSHEHFSIHFKHPGLHRMGRGCIFVRLLLGDLNGFDRECRTQDIHTTNNKPGESLLSEIGC